MFDINDAKDLFSHIKRTMKGYCEKEVKDPAELLFLIMALNHLREWIAPRYHKVDQHNWPPADTPAKQFSQDIYEFPEFVIIRKLCNHSKHFMTSQNPPDTDTNTDSEHLLKFNDYPDVDSIPNFDKAVTDYFVDGKNVIDIINTVIDFYKTEWFERNEGD